MGGSISSLFGVTDEEQPSQDYLQLTDLGGFLTKYVFIMLDKDKTKQVSKQEYLTLVNHFREKKTTEEELDSFLKKNVGEGESTDFINEVLFKKLIIQLAIDFDQNVSDRMKYLMTLFDKDRDGFVSESDLCNVYEAIGIQVPSEPVRCLVQKYDKDKDGKLSVEEFEQLGRSAMSKLFVKRDTRKIEDLLVEEALKRGSASLIASSGGSGCGEVCGLATATNSLQSYHQENRRPVYRDLNNNDRTSSDFMLVDSVVFGEPVKLKDTSTSSSLFPDFSESSIASKRNSTNIGNSGDAISIEGLKGMLSELQLEDVED